ncbi:MAG: bifunctional DNA-formamidopyrimidine glycosylase/DNA-(apurinic or apyrimidinic site) lyase [Candidatus Zambryskibacteria bacterium]|nr:bifunctional DNA-formamidopyrimidine glycosylase/DNA-(apurinic or apyrimidinic site) lyase [Candidatus Zambryskibacteria bacterium]
MPELPEVTTTVAGLNKVLPKLTIQDVWTDYYLRTKNKRQNTIKNKKYFAYFKKEVVGEKVLLAERRGKNILIHLSDGKTILIHMKMTGHLLYGKYSKLKVKSQKSKVAEKWVAAEKGLLQEPFNKFIHLVFTLSNGKHLAFSDMRKFAKVMLFETNRRDEITDLSILGPEPLDNLSLKTFKKQLLTKPNSKIKTVLMDQTIVAGIGNIYSDEILWLAGVHPERKINSLENEEMKKILKKMKKILKVGIKMGGDSMSDYRNIHGEKGQFQKTHKAYRRTKEKCLKKECLGVIQRKVIGGRSAHFCNKHQK